MYYSYLRGKKFELLAIREMLPVIVGADISVILEPVRGTPNDLNVCLDAVSATNGNLILIVNPSVGDLHLNSYVRETVIGKVLESAPKIDLGILISEKTTVTEINQLLHLYPSYNFVLIHEGEFNDLKQLNGILQQLQVKKNVFIADHCSEFYQQEVKKCSKPAILIKDGFRMQPTNADYANNLVEYFSDLYSNYSQHGYQGFGDFSIVGDYYSEGGGQAKTVAIHLTYPDKNNHGIRIQHFLSEERFDYESVSILIDEALSKLKDFLTYDRPDILSWSSSCRNLIDIYDQNRNTSLAYIKKLSISHHFELMAFLTQNS